MLRGERRGILDRFPGISGEPGEIPDPDRISQSLRLARLPLHATSELEAMSLYRRSLCMHSFPSQLHPTSGNATRRRGRLQFLSSIHELKRALGTDASGMRLASQIHLLLSAAPELAPHDMSSCRDAIMRRLLQFNSMHMNSEIIEDGSRWDELLLSLPAPHMLQSWTWGDLKSRFGWSAKRLAWLNDAGVVVAAGQLLSRSSQFSGGLKIAYCPKGPVLDWGDSELRFAILASLVEAARDEGALVLKIDPEVAYETGAAEAVADQLLTTGWQQAPKSAQFRNTLILNLLQDEEALLQGMKQKWRYNVRLAGRKGVTVRRGTAEDLELLFRMYAKTARRDGFVIRTRDYYLDAWGSFTQQGLAQPLIAEVDGTPVAGQIIYRFGKTAWYLYGMSTNLHREKMPNHLLHWEAIRWAKEQACERYDFVGAPDELKESDSMWGVYRFKKGFGGDFVRTIGEWDFALRPTAYRAYRLLMPIALSAMRFLGRRRVARQAS